MPLTSLLPIGGAALGMLAARTLAGLTENLSFQSHLLGSQASNSDKSSTGSTDTRVTVNLEKSLPQLVSDLHERFLAAGVDLSQPIVLKDDGHGGLLVDGDHPDRSLIEDILSQDSKLSADFQAVAAAATERRQSYALSADNAFGEFRLRFADETAAVRFE